MKKYISHNFSVWRQDKEYRMSGDKYISGTYEDATKAIVEFLKNCPCPVRLLWTRQEMIYTGPNHYTGSPRIDNILSICDIDGPWYEPQDVINKIMPIKNPPMTSKPEYMAPVEPVVDRSLKDD